MTDAEPLHGEDAEDDEGVDDSTTGNIHGQRRVPNPNGGTGKKKIAIQYIPDLKHRMQIYHKRKAGILKKLDELNKLTGSDMIFILHEPNGKIVTFTSSKFAEKTKKIAETLHEP